MSDEDKELEAWEEDFNHWWENEGMYIGRNVEGGEDRYEHVRRVARIAWSNRDYCEEKRRASAFRPIKPTVVIEATAVMSHAKK